MPRITLSPDVVFRSFGTETVLLNLKTGQYHGLKGSGGRMLEVLTETGELEAAAGLLAEEYSQPLERIRGDLQAMCDSLAERSLVTVSDE